jgi:LCP family protein required for cell wall assembly
MQEASGTKRWKVVLGWVSYGLLVSVALAGGTLLGWAKDSPVIKGILNPFKDSPAEVFGRNDITILLLGTDEDRAPGGRTIDREAARSDMIMVARLHFDEKKITGITIPRDTLARVPGHSTRRINAFHSIGGADLAKEAVEALIGVKIDRVVVINYRVFREMVDLIGGLDLNVEKRLRYEDERGDLHIDLDPGFQHLDGRGAMGYVRYRKDSDFNRQGRQRNFLVAFKEQATKPGNLRKAPELVNKTNELTSYVFSDKELSTLMLFAKEVGTSNINLGMLPVYDAGNYDLAVELGKLKDTLEEFELIDP